MNLLCHNYDATEWRPAEHNENKEVMWAKRDGKWFETVFFRFKDGERNDNVCLSKR